MPSEAKAAMPAESNAPATLRVGVRPPVGNHKRVRLVDHSPTAAYMDEAIHEYVRADLVVPTVDEIADAIKALREDGCPKVRLYMGQTRRVAETFRALLLERIEGDHPGSRWVMPGEVDRPQVGMDGKPIEGDHDELA